MQDDYTLKDDDSSAKLSSRGTSIYYLGSIVFLIGIILVVLGSALVVYFQIHYGSEPWKIFYTILSIAAGLILILTGINLMIRQMKKGYAIIVVSGILATIAMYLFYMNYFDNFYYPLVGYIFGFYIVAFLLLLGNAFASVIVWIIGNKPEYVIKKEDKEPSRLYTDEEIQRDIEEATNKVVESAINELQFEIEQRPSDILMSKSVSKIPGNIIRVKDDIDEVISLKQTLAPGSTEKWGSIGIDKASMQLAKALEVEHKKESRFSGFKFRLFKKNKKKEKKSKKHKKKEKKAKKNKKKKK
ncbi:hypothetical protein AYK24_03835 [Thermoplasmatales archaeon SG8-52-4]|nr:MAG: hypothetical protein AYK24_03835 [Thermoplasmatales archaeon SG8-52-4]